MGRRARERLHERTTPGERLDIGLDLLEEELDRVIARMDVPEGLDEQERASWIVQRLLDREA